MFRLSAHADPAFLAEMLYEAVNWHDDGAEERPALDTVLAVPENARYIEGWGRTGDTAFVRARPLATSRSARRGCARFTAAEPGYGYVADDVPELSIAVYPEFRGQRVGTLLLGSVIARAERDRTRAISLSVNREQSCQAPVRARTASRSSPNPATPSRCSSRSPEFLTTVARETIPGAALSRNSCERKPRLAIGAGRRGGCSECRDEPQEPEAAQPAPPPDLRGPALERGRARGQTAPRRTRRGSSSSSRCSC